MKPSVAIVGGSGFIGSNLYDRLRRENIDVTVLDVEKNQQIESDDFRFFDVLNPAESSKLLKNIDALFYKAGKKGPEPSFQDPLPFYQTNLEGTLRTLEECVKQGVDQFIYDSSESVFGAENNTPFGEDDHPQPSSIYGTTKTMSENYLLYVSEQYPIDITIFRYPRVVSSTNSNVLRSIGQAVARQEEVVITASGKKRFDLVSLQDVVEWNLWALRNNSERILHVTGGFDVSAQEIVREASAYLHGNEEYDRLNFTENLSANDKLLPDNAILDNQKSMESTSLCVEYNNLRDLYHPILKKLESDLIG